jgi:ribonucleoside-diphosphate reductase alpha chain
MFGGVDKKSGKAVFDHKKLYDVVKVMVRNLNSVIDRNHYPLKECERSNLKHRPMGIGVQGLADLFMIMGLPWDSEGAAELNRDIFETMYFAALTASNEIAMVNGTYESYEGSPMSRGILHFDTYEDTHHSGRWDWDDLRNKIKLYGVRNSLLLAMMPTASTSQMLKNNEGIEPYMENVMLKKTLAREFPIFNHHLYLDLKKRGLWNKEIIDKIIANSGSIQDIDEIPYDIKEIYKTAWEISQATLIRLAAARARYIDQSQSFNYFFAEPNYEKLTTAHFMCWKSGLKAEYYLRQKSAQEADKVTSEQKETINKKRRSSITQDDKMQPNTKKTKPETKDQEKEEYSDEEQEDYNDGAVCTMQEGCITCGS